MGKSTRYFRQTSKSISGSQGARNFSQVVRSGGWHIKAFNYIKVRGKQLLTNKEIKQT